VSFSTGADRQAWLRASSRTTARTRTARRTGNVQGLNRDSTHDAFFRDPFNLTLPSRPLGAPEANSKGARKSPECAPAERLVNEASPFLNKRRTSLRQALQARRKKCLPARRAAPSAPSAQSHSAQAGTPAAHPEDPLAEQALGGLFVSVRRAGRALSQLTSGRRALTMGFSSPPPAASQPERTCLDPVGLTTAD
jgi:hypothetical protein